MTKEPIMIDDVDVSECDFLAKEDDYCSYSGEYRAYKGQCGCSDEEFCKDHPNCFYKKALKQLKSKEQEYNRLSNLITSTKAYELTCSNCRDAILTAPTISGKTKFSQIEVEEISLRMIIKQLKDKEQECEEWKNKYYSSTTEVKADLIKQLYQLKVEGEELKTEFDKFEEQIKLQGNFIDSFLFATKNSEWRNKSILEDEADAIIEKVESDYVQLENYKQALQGIKKLVERNHCSGYETCKECYNTSTCPNDCINKEILQKCEVKE